MNIRKTRYDINKELPADKELIELICTQLENSYSENEIIFIDGGFGVGKTYKTISALKYNEKKFYSFQAYNTGFDENFLLILYRELISNKKRILRLFVKVKVILCGLKSKRNLHLIYVFLLVIGSLGMILKIGDAKTSNFDKYIYFATTCVSFLMFPELLSFKKDYSIYARTFYNDIIIQLMPEYLLIDDFDRLDQKQQNSIFEFINYFKGSNNKKKKIILLGNMSNCKERYFEAGNSEDSFTKFIDRTISIPSSNSQVMHKIFNMKIESISIEEQDSLCFANQLEGLNYMLTRRVLEEQFIKYLKNSKDDNIINVFNFWLTNIFSYVTEKTRFVREESEKNDISWEDIEYPSKNIALPDKYDEIKNTANELKKISQIIHRENLKYSYDEKNIKDLLNSLHDKTYTKHKMKRLVYDEFIWYEEKVDVPTLDTIKTVVGQYVSEKNFEKFISNQKMQNIEINTMVVKVSNMFTDTFTNKELPLHLIQCDDEKNVILKIMEDVAISLNALSYVKPIIKRYSEMNLKFDNIVSEIANDTEWSRLSAQELEDFEFEIVEIFKKENVELYRELRLLGKQVVVSSQLIIWQQEKVEIE